MCCSVAIIVYKREQDLWRFDRKLDDEDGGEGLGESILETHLRMRKYCG
jgi:hypothetical protein